MDIKENSLVRFKPSLYEDEEGAIYRIVEINGDRCILEFMSSSMKIQPQSIAMLSDLVLFEEKE